MPRGVVPVTTITRTGVNRAGITPTVGDPTNGHSVPNSGGMWLEVKNTNGGSTARTVTFTLPGSSDGQGYVPKTKSIAAGVTYMLGPWPPGAYSGSLLVDVDNAELTIAAFKLSDA